MSRNIRIALVSALMAVLAAAIYSCSTLGLDGGKSESATVGNGFTTDLIAGDGAGNGPGNGTDAGDITFTDNGTTLNIAIDMDDANNWSAGNFHIYIGDDIPVNPNNGKPTVAPGQFPYNAGNGTWTVEGDTWNGSFDIAGLNGPLVIAVHGEGLEGGQAGLFEVGCQGAPIAEFGLYYGSTDILAGTVYLTFDGANILVTVEMDAPYTMYEAQLFLEPSPAEPPFSPGSWEYNAGTLANLTSYTFEVPLSDLGIVGPDPFSIPLTMALHVSLTDGSDGSSESATAWGADGCRTPLAKENGDEHAWKSYTDCILAECEDGWVEIIEDANEETLWAESDDDGWFPNNGFNRWGWFIDYQPGL